MAAIIDRSARIAADPMSTAAIRSLERMGADRRAVAQLMAFETVFVLVAGALVASGLVAATSLIGTSELLSLLPEAP